jgi:hypothetical protein
MTAHIKLQLLPLISVGAGILVLLVPQLFRVIVGIFLIAWGIISMIK